MPSDVRSGAVTSNCVPRCCHNAAGTMRTASSSRPDLPKKPICSARASLSASRRRSSITRCSFPVNVMSASISKSLKSRGRYRRPSHVDYQSFMFWTSPQGVTIARQKTEQQPLDQL